MELSLNHLFLLRKKLKQALTIERTTAPRTAGIKPSTVNPGTNQAARRSIRPFTIKAKIPKVIIEIGRAISWTMGLMRALTRPTTIAAIARV